MSDIDELERRRMLRRAEEGNDHISPAELLTIALEHIASGKHKPKAAIVILVMEDDDATQTVSYRCHLDKVGELGFLTMRILDALSP